MTPIEPDGGIETALDRFAGDHGASVLRLDESIDHTSYRIPSLGFNLPICLEPGGARKRAALLRSVREDRRNAWVAAWLLGCWRDDPEVVEALRESLPRLGEHAAVSLGYIGDVASMPFIEEAWRRCVRDFDLDDDLRADEHSLFGWTYAWAALAWLCIEDVRQGVAERIEAVSSLFESPERARSVADLVAELRAPRKAMSE